MNTFKIVVSIDCDTEAQRKAFEQRIDDCVKEAQRKGEISNGFVDSRKLLQGTVGLKNEALGEDESIPMQLSYDELFEPEADAL